MDWKTAMIPLSALIFLGFGVKECDENSRQMHAEYMAEREQRCKAFGGYIDFDYQCITKGHKDD
jgi:hypothetical protein